MNKTPFINRSEVKKFLLEYSTTNKYHKFTRVSEQTLIDISESVRQKCIAHVRSFPSKGKTL